MSKFRDGVLVWCSIASRLLGWRPEEFWRATPAELISAVREPETNDAASAPSRDLIAKMLERDNHE